MGLLGEILHDMFGPTKWSIGHNPYEGYESSSDDEDSYNEDYDDEPYDD